MATNWQPPTIPAPPAPEPTRRSWFARHKILTALLGIVALLVLAQAFNGGGTAPVTNADTPDVVATTPATTAAARAGSGAAAPEAEVAKVGSAVRDGQFEFTVTKVEAGVHSVGSDLFGEKAQGQFVLVHVRVENIGDKAQLFADSSQKVRDAKGREFSADTAAAIHIKDNEVFLNEINPGNKVSGVLVFDMPKDAKPATIELHDSPFSGGATVRLG